ncbi:hypothetical protein CBR_g49221 [Chara braunii]|uniref:ABC transporter domain-containing protein n=1 Tax=Chara braunii TaxID=69332 RepID=A0A388M4B4_CHABU|nr:hypothetical protein CBR_g49221 [Chara braunii]|eukprot:GBG89430.1 hypothetical protein CBR_g49221 [Chara braunii]
MLEHLLVLVKLGLDNLELQPLDQKKKQQSVRLLQSYHLAIAEEQAAKLKAIAEEQAVKMRKFEEMKRVQQEEEERRKAAEEEAATEEAKERMRIESREGSSGTKKDEDAEMEKKISGWITNLSLGEDEEAEFYVPQDERDTLAQELKMAALARENKERKELQKQAKLKAIAEEQAAKMRKFEEEMKRVQQEEMKRVQQEEEERRKAAEEEAAAEEAKERMRIECREWSSGTKDEDAEMEKKISEWIANLSLGEDEEVEFYVPQDERDTLAQELAVMDEPLERQEREEEKKSEQEVQAQADDKAKWDKVLGYLEVLSAVWMEERQANRSQEVVLSAMWSGFREFVHEMVTHVGGEVRRLRDNARKFCEGAIEGAKVAAVVEGEAIPRKEPVKLEFPNAYGGKSDENVDNSEASVNSYVYLQHIVQDNQWRSAKALKGVMDDLVATETQLVQLFYRAMLEPLRGHFFDKSQQPTMTYDTLNREVVLFEAKSMPITTFWHKDLDKGCTISGQVRAKDHMILTSEEGDTDEVPYSQIEWGLEEEDSSVGQGRSYAAVAAGGRPQSRGGGQGQRGQAMGGRGPGARGLADKGTAKWEVGVKVPRQIARVLVGPHNDEVEGHLKEDGTGQALGGFGLGPTFMAGTRGLGLLKKEAIWQWDKDCTSALKKLKRALIEYSVLKVADPSLPFVVTTDASQYGIGAVLQQDDDNGYRPVEFMPTRMPSEKVLPAMLIVKAYAAERVEMERFRSLAAVDLSARLEKKRCKAMMPLAITGVYAITVMVLFAAGTWAISRRKFSGAGMVSFVTSLVLLIEPIQAVSTAYNEIKQGEPAVERIFELMAKAPKIVDRMDAKAEADARGDVEFRDVSFRYCDGGPWALKNVSFQAKEGKTIAIVGPSGGGKTTLAKMLLRLYDPQAGVIFLDGQDIREFTLRRLRQLVSIVPQETVIFTGNVITNIAYGDMSQDIDVEAVARAARLANAHEFIDRLPEKYLTELGNRGSSLSGGQRQRLSIARAIHRSPTVLVLDEATSALDNQSEKLVREALEHLMEGRTVLVIAHRLETIRNADWILYMEGGEILEEGKHDELLSRGGRYSILYEQQASPGAAYGSQGEQLSLY